MSRRDMVGQNMTSTPEPLSTDTAFELLADEQRRRALRLVAEEDGPLTVDQLVDALLADTAHSADSDTTRDQLEISLHHTHLPKLHDAGVIEYDPQRETIRYHAPDIVEELLEQC